MGVYWLTRTIDILPDKTAHIIDVSSRLMAIEWDLTIGPTRHAYFGVRLVETVHGS